MKIYNSSWNAKKLEIDFNQKQWRQDLAAFISQKEYWYRTKVSRSKTVEKKTKYNSSIREFKVFDGCGGNVQIRYTNKNEIIYTTNDELVALYFQERGLN